MEGTPDGTVKKFLSLSHGCGDGGNELFHGRVDLRSFPRMWGWRGNSLATVVPWIVFPTDVGMEGSRGIFDHYWKCLSHGCGDGGVEGELRLLAPLSFSRIWGWRRVVKWYYSLWFSPRRSVASTAVSTNSVQEGIWE